MGEIGFYEEGKKQWIQYDEDTEVLILLLSKEEIRAIGQKSSKAGKKSGPVYDKLLGRAAVKGWRHKTNLDQPGFSVKGQPFPFSLENLDELMIKSSSFSKFVNDQCLNEDAFIEDLIEIKKD
jgi:hypothetical protein